MQMTKLLFSAPFKEAVRELASELPLERVAYLFKGSEYEILWFIRNGNQFTIAFSAESGPLPVAFASNFDANRELPQPRFGAVTKDTMVAAATRFVELLPYPLEPIVAVEVDYEDVLYGTETQAIGALH